MADSSGGKDIEGVEPVLPIFVQMNVRLKEEDNYWKEVARWVKFQESVEDGGKRWSKPFVPSCSYSVMSELRQELENSPILLDKQAQSIQDIIDLILEREPFSDLTMDQQEGIKELFNQGVKQKIRISFVRQVSQSSANVFSGSGFLHKLDPNSEAIREDEETPARLNKSAPSSPERIRKLTRGNFSQDDTKPLDDDEEQDDQNQGKRRHFTVTFMPEVREEAMKLCELNVFNKKLPKNAEACVVQVASCDFVSDVMIAMVRLAEPLNLAEYCEVNKLTRFFCFIVGPAGSGARIQELGKSLATLFTDQLFCTFAAYRGTSKRTLLHGLDNYIEELTVLPASAWDPNIRLDPPKATQNIQSRMAVRAGLRHRHNIEDDIEDDIEEEEFKSFQKKEKPTDHAAEDGLQFTGRPFGGLVEDIRRKLPFFVSDFTDALHIQTIASIIYIYLATITKAITFGGFLGDITNGFQGVLESFLGHALAGGVFCLLAGQPLTVLGCTGPVLIFEKILVDFCSENDLSYLTMRLWIGFWSAAFCFLIVAIDASAIVRYFTRFTEEAFAALVGIIFIVESFKKLFKMGKSYKVHKGYDPYALGEEHCFCIPPNSTDKMPITNFEREEILQHYNVTIEDEGSGNLTYHPSDVPWQDLRKDECVKLLGSLEGSSCKYVPDVFLFSVLLFFGTFLLCNILKKFKFTPYFPTKVRKLIADYAVILTIILFVMLDMYFDLATPKLIVPTVFKPTRSDIRGWIIPVFDDKSSWYVYLLASIPALLLTILIFMDQQITSVIVNRKEHKLRKGGGYHLDMLIIGIMMAVCSILGLPWCVAATVLCLGHVDSLKMDTESSAPGEQAQFLGVREQRVSGVMVFILTGLSVKLAPILKFIPMPVLYGVLLYMGVNTLNGMQFIDRILLMFMPTKHQPDYLYLRHVPIKKVHLFTLIQAGTLAGLWLIKSTPASLIFPLMVLALVGFRKLMDFFPSIFSQNDLYWLDNLIPHSNKKKKSGQKKKKKDKKKKKEISAKNSGPTTSDEEKEMLPNGEA